MRRLKPLLKKIAQTKNLRIVPADWSYDALPNQYKNGDYIIWGVQVEDRKNDKDKTRDDYKFTAVQSIGAWGGFFRQAHFEEINKKNSRIYIIEIYELHKTKFAGASEPPSDVVVLVWHYDTLGNLKNKAAVTVVKDMHASVMRSQVVNNIYYNNNGDGKELVYLGDEIKNYTAALAKTKREFAESRTKRVK